MRLEMGILLRALLRLQGRISEQRWERSARDLGKTQAEFLMRLLHSNRHTEYGRKHRFSSIRSEKEYREVLPIVDYNDLAPYMTAIREGRQAILTAEPVYLLVRTSGTTAHPKLIPVTHSSLHAAHRTMRLWLYSCLRAHPDAFGGHMLIITGSAREGVLDTGLPYGSASGLMPDALPGWLHDAFAAPPCIAAVEDYSLRYYLLARAAFAKSVSFVASPNPLTLVRLCECADAHQEKIVRAIHNGWISDAIRNPADRTRLGLPPGLDRLFQPNPGRSRFLDDVLKRVGRLAPPECWPDLQLLGCWLGGSIGHQASLLDTSYPGVPRRDLGYMASEGVFTLPTEDGTPVGMLVPDTNYYEFIPAEGEGSKTTLSACDLEAGQAYRILITNYQGLYRYDINDIVQVHGYRHGLPLLSFARKGSNMLDIAGEKLHLNHFLFAMEKLRTAFSLDIRQFRVAPLVGELRYEFFVDIRGDLDSQFAASVLLPALDAYLCESNMEYQSRRNSGRLHAPVLNLMASEWEERLRNHDLAGGLNETQYKWRQLAAEPIDLDRRYVLVRLE